MGLVYKGRHETLARDAAIKTLLPKHAGDSALSARLLREAQAQARLEHEHIVTVYDLIEEDAELFVAMEYVDGETLAQYLDRQLDSRLKLREALPIFEQILDALAYVHGRKIVHRDVKPSNVMVAGHQVKLTDFGVALLPDLPRITASLQRLGTPPYMSPEQLEGKTVDHRSDQYSAAVLLYRMLAGRLPFEAEDYYAQIRERYARPVDLRMLLPELPAGVCEAVAIALRPDRDERFPSVVAFRNALREGEAGFLVGPPQAISEALPPRAEDVLTERMVVPSPLPPPGPKPRRPVAAIVMIVLGTFAAATVILRKEQSPPPPMMRGLPQTAPSMATPSAAASSTTASPSATVPSAATSSAPSLLTEPPPHQQQLPVPPDAEQAATAEKQQQPKEIPFRAAAPPVEDLEARRRARLESLRDEIRRGLARAEDDLTAERFDPALEELDRAAGLAQTEPVEFSDEHRQIALLRTRVIETRVSVETARKEAAHWASRVARIEEDLAAERWPEAKRFAEELATDPRVPAEVGVRARALLERARDGWKRAFKDTQVGPTDNTIRKPSSPPRKDV